MASVWTLTLVSVFLVSVLSFTGALTLTLGILRRHSVLLGLVAFAAGALIGDALLHLLPEAAELWGGVPIELSAWIIGGFVAFYLFEVVVRWGHAHGEAEHPHVAPPLPEAVAIAPFAWTNLIGDGIHNFIDGVVMGASYLVSAPLGFATTIAVAAHEIPQELGDFAVLRKAGLSTGRALFYNFLSALLSVLGGILVLIIPVGEELVSKYAVPLTAGGFLYIAAADLIPELHHHSERRFAPLILAGLLVGIGAMALLLSLEG